MGAPGRREQVDSGDCAVKIIDNVNDTLGDDLKDELGTGVKVRIAGSAFLIVAFETLRKELELMKLVTA